MRPAVHRILKFLELLGPRFLHEHVLGRRCLEAQFAFSDLWQSRQGSLLASETKVEVIFRGGALLGILGAISFLCGAANLHCMILCHALSVGAGRRGHLLVVGVTAAIAVLTAAKTVGAQKAGLRPGGARLKGGTPIILEVSKVDFLILRKACVDEALNGLLLGVEGREVSEISSLVSQMRFHGRVEFARSCQVPVDVFKKWMAHNIQCITFGAQPIFRLSVEKSFKQADELGAGLAQASKFERALSRLNLLEQVRLGFTGDRSVTSEHFVEEDAQRPPVD